MMVVLFSLLTANCSQQEGPTNKASKMLSTSSENWLNKSEARRAKAGEQSQGIPDVDAVHRAGHEQLRTEETAILPPWKTTLGVTSASQPCAEAWGGGVRDQARPSRFLWLSLGRSFDLFLTKTAEIPGIGSLAARG